MRYERAFAMLSQRIAEWKPEGEWEDLLHTALDAISDCLEMGLAHPEDDPDEGAEANSNEEVKP